MNLLKEYVHINVYALINVYEIKDPRKNVETLDC